MIREKAKVNLFGKMDESMMGCGRTENSMGRENLLQKKMWRELANGIMVTRSDGCPEYKQNFVL
jgi:hypothetical protein